MCNHKSIRLVYEILLNKELGRWVCMDCGHVWYSKPELVTKETNASMRKRLKYLENRIDVCYSQINRILRTLNEDINSR